MSGSPGTASAPTSTGERRLALVVATQTYADPSLRQLRAPARDVDDLRGVLADPEVGGFEVSAVTDRAAHQIRLAIEDFLADRRTDDLVLIYLSCHGLVDVRRRLFFAAADTRKNRLAATGVEAQWLLAPARRLPCSPASGDLGLLLQRRIRQRHEGSTPTSAWVSGCTEGGADGSC